MLTAAVVTLVCLLLCIRLLSELVRLWHRTPFVWITEGGKCWAVITGAGNGMGFEYARQLALKGYNLLLISLLDEELVDAKLKIIAELKSINAKQIEIRTLMADFGRDDIYAEIAHFIDLPRNDVFVLVNNVGTSLDMPKAFLSDNYARRNRTIINVNIMAMTRLMELVLPHMVRQKRGLIINMASGSCFVPCPWLSIYASSKSYVKKLSECVAEEYRSDGITFCTLCPFWVATSRVLAPSSSLVPSARHYVSLALAAIKYQGHVQSVSYWSHELQYLWGNVLEWLFTYRMKALYMSWLMRRFQSFDTKLRAFYQDHPKVQPTKWQQIKFFLSDDDKVE